MVRPRIATKLALLLIPLVLLPFASLGYFWYSETRAELEAQVQRELHARLRQFALRLRPFLRERVLDLEDVVSSPAIEDYHTQVDYRLLEEAEVARRKLAEYLVEFAQRRKGFVTDVRYLDERGIEVAAATPEGLRPGHPDRSGMPLFQRAREGPPGRIVSVAVERSEALGSQVLRLSIPVHNRWQEFRGLIVLSLPMDYIDTMLADALAGRQGTPFLLDREGTILGPPGAHEALQAQWEGPDALDATLRALPRLAEAIHLPRLSGGGRGLLAHAPVGAEDWSAGILAPLSETEVRVAALTRFTLTYGAIAALALVGVAVLVARGAGRRVRRLQGAAAQVTQGNFSLRLPTETRDELGDLARSFNTMAESLARRDVEVQARTEEAERRRQELEVLNTVIHAAHTSLNLRQSLEAILNNLLALFQFRSGAVRLLNAASGTLEMAAHRGLRPAYAAKPIPLRAEEGHMGRTLQVRRPLVFNDPADLADLQDRVAEGEAVGGALFVPILSQDQPLGVIALVADRALNFTEAELNLLASIGLEVGSAINNARAFSQTEALLAEAKRHRTRAEALAEIGQAVTATLEVERVLDLLVERTCTAMGADAAGMLRLEDGAYRYVRSWGLSVDHVRRFSLGPGEGVVGAAAAARASVWTVDVLADPRFNPQQMLALNEGEGIRAILTAPIILGDELYGVLTILHRQRHEFSPEEVGFAGAVAQQAAIALHNARLYADLQAAYQQLKTAQDQAVQVEKLRALGEMAAGVAHDFNNLLAAILGRAQLLRTRTTDPQARASLQVIERAALDGAETVRRILGFARTRRDEPMEMVDVEAVLRQVIEVTSPRWKAEAQARGIAIQVQMDLEPVPPVRGNPAELREVFVNLVFNAVDAMPGGGTITLGARRLAEDTPGGEGHGGGVEISVRDAGTGMSEEVLLRAFDPFFTTKGQRGSGLGLSVVFGIVSRHGGSIEIDSREGRGTTMKVRLPVGTPSKSRPAAEPVPASAATARIVVVDDEEMLAELLAEMLRLGGHVAEAFTDPRQALARLQSNSVDLLFTDLGMPGLSGWDVAAHARALRPDLPVILVTGWGHQIDPERLRASGVFDVVAKPYRLEDISRAVAAALKARPQPA